MSVHNTSAGKVDGEFNEGDISTPSHPVTLSGDMKVSLIFNRRGKAVLERSSDGVNYWPVGVITESSVHDVTEKDDGITYRLTCLELKGDMAYEMLVA